MVFSIICFTFIENKIDMPENILDNDIRIKSDDRLYYVGIFGVGASLLDSITICIRT